MSLIEKKYLYSSIVGYWPIYDGTGSTVSELKSANNGTWQGTLGSQWATTGPNGPYSGVLNGSDNYIDCGAPAAFDLTASITLFGWVKSTVGNWQQIVSKWSSSGAVSSVGAYGLATSLTNSSAQLVVYQGSSQIGLVGNTAINDGRYHFIAGTYDGTTMILYIDGALDNSTTSASGAIDTTNAKVLLGARESTHGSTFTDFLNGNLANVGVANRAWTQNEVKLMMMSPFGVPGGVRHVSVGNGMSRNEGAT